MRLNGIALNHCKGTENVESIRIPLPKVVKLPLSQHMGAPCSPLVKVGDEVLVGQKIGDTDAFMSAPIHSSVSGTVKEMGDYLLANGRVCQAITIETDGNQTVSPDVVPPKVNDKASFVKAVRESGCCGLGGAGFPTHIKLNFDENKTPIDSLVINAAECEPYITSDYRELIEHPEDVVDGVYKVMEYLNIKKAYICIESNKPKAIKDMKARTQGNDAVKVVTLKSSYPQGAEKVVAFSATGRIIGEGELPANKGIIVMNVSTAGFISRYLETGMPLVERRLTIDGDIPRTPCNVIVPIGTSVSNLLEYSDCNIELIGKLLAGGPMMGMCLYDIQTPITKTNNAILAFKRNDKKIEAVKTACIHCGRCIHACPLRLMPTEIEKAFEAKDKEELLKLKVNLCMNCGSCSYVCPAKHNLAEINQLAKELIR